MENVKHGNKEKRSDIQVPAAITKADIDTTAKLMGSVNSSAITLAGKRRDSGSVQFLCFAGALDGSTNKYVGEYRFALGKFPESKTTDLNKLPGLNGAPNGAI